MHLLSAGAGDLGASSEEGEALKILERRDQWKNRKRGSGSRECRGWRREAESCGAKVDVVTSGY